MFVCSECGAALPAPGQCPNDGTQLSMTGEDVLLGTMIGVYRIARLLGVGGMGRVYKGVHPSIGSRVAIKVLSRECTDRPDLVERFFAEAKAVNMIRHENIVNVLDLARLPDSRPYIIMEYLDGAPLASVIDTAIAMQAPLPLGGMARLAVEVLDALGAAHAKNIVHRDLKPDNIFVAPSGRPKVLDFGIAKLNDASVGSATRTGSLLGTPHYMAPEQAAGRSVDHRADIYAMGVILFECATGTKPFLADSLFDLLRKHIETPPPSPRSLRHELSPGLESVILTALAKSPDDRFATAQAMSMALQHATAPLPPDQWAPITGSGVHNRTEPGGWLPTPPASWGGRPSQPSQPPPHSSEQPLHAARIGQQSTVSASSGQVAVQKKQGSKTGLWVAIAAILIVGGGVTAAVLASGGGDSNGTQVAAGDPPAPPNGSAEPAGSAAGSAAPGSAAPADKTVPAKDKAAAPKADEDDPDPDQALEDITKDLPPDVKKELDAALDSLPPELRKDLQELEKLPTDKRKAKIQELQKKLAKMAGTDSAPAAKARGATTAAKTDDPGQGQAPAQTQPSTSTSTSPTPVPQDPDGEMVMERPLRGPPGWDPKHADAQAFVTWALAEAKRNVPDAQLTRVEIEGLSPDGRADLTLPTLASDHGSIELRFISPSRMKKDPKAPIGVPQKHKLACEFRIEAEPGAIIIRPISVGIGCDKDTPIRAPRCSPKAVWDLAKTGGAPSANAIANISYYGWQGAAARWYFAIGFGMDVKFSTTIGDGC